MFENNSLHLKNLSFCFISYTGRTERPILDPSTRYRSFHPADELRKLGFFSVVSSHTEFFNKPNFGYDVYIFHRPSRNIKSPARFDSVISQLKKKGKILIADYDDLIFGDEEIALQSSLSKNGRATKEQCIEIYKNNLSGLEAFDKIIVSTRTLADVIRRFKPTAEVTVLPNFIPSSLLNIYENNSFYQKVRPKGTIGYFAGTASHNKDILVVLEPLHRVLVENPSFTLLVVGPVNIPNALIALPNVVANPVVNYMRLPSLMQFCETVIAPLEISLFNDCKSRVKFLEAALSGCRLIATPITDMKDVGNDFISFAETNEDWYNSLSSIPSEERLMNSRINNFKYLREHCSITPLLKMVGIE